MKLQVGTNWDTKLINIVGDRKEVTEFYGCAPSTMVGTGRPSFILGKISDEEIPNYIKKVHEKGLEFNYTLNAPCMNNEEFNIAKHKKLISQLEFLVESGVDGFTVSIPYLIELIKKQFPNVKVKASLIAQINSVQKLKFYESLGADEVMIDYMVNRDFKLLEQMREAANGKLTLIVNDFCLYQCPYRNYHYNCCGHASQQEHSTKGFYIEYCAMKCTLERLNNPALLISSRWIRPEDLKEYENIGYDSFKLSGRRMATHWIANVVNAYANRSYDGNLSDLIDYSLLGMEENVHMPRYEELLNGVKELNSDNFMKIGMFYPKRPFIDNKKLDGFLKPFMENHCSGQCDKCGYCKAISKDVVTLDKEEVKRQKEMYGKLVEDLITSRMFYQKPEDKEEIEMEWERNLEETFKNIMSFAPEQFYEVAEKLIRKGIQDNAHNRGSSIIQEEDLVQSFIINTPAYFKAQMIQGLVDNGIDIAKYGLEQ